MKTLSIIIPAFNEENTILDIINKVESVKLNGDVKKELIIVNDCSTDLTEDRINQYIKVPFFSINISRTIFKIEIHCHRIK